MAVDATVDTRTSIFYGGWITKLFKHFIQRTPSSFNRGVGTTKVDIAICRSMNLNIDCPDGTMRFKDSKGQNPNDPGMIVAIEDIPNCPRPGKFPGSSSRGGNDFLYSTNLYNIMQETLQVSKNAYSLGQSSSTQIGDMECNIHAKQNDITYIRDHMKIRDDDEEVEDEGHKMDLDLVAVVSGDVGIMQVKSLTL
ncbi:hypothetical protein Hanom_Chr03g00189851 [Helianthus anomalus]